jgi:acetyltransferase-like isoleucine patch superfamily enzyme
MHTGIVKKSKLPVKDIVLTGLLPSFLKKWIYRMRGYKIGKGVSIGLGSVIVGDKVEIGDYTDIGFLTIIRGREIKIGRHVEIGSLSVIDTVKIEIGDDAVITEQVFIGGMPTPESSIKMGKRSIIMQMSFINPTKPLVIGDDAGIGGNCLIFTHASWQSPLDGFPIKFAGVTIGNNAWLPWRVFVMPGVTIGDNSTIGANSLVNKDIPAGALAAGSPIKILKTADEYPQKVDMAGKQAIMSDIMNEFKGYLEHHSFSADIVRSENYWMVDVKKSSGSYKVYYNFNGQFTDIASLNANTVLVNMHDESQTTIDAATQGKFMLIEILKKQRWGSNSIGEEMITFLKRYGLRFNRP